jgi:hypothetical protein
MQNKQITEKSVHGPAPQKQRERVARTEEVICTEGGHTVRVIRLNRRETRRRPERLD